MIKIFRRSLTENEAALLVSEIKKTPNITGYKIKELIDCENCIVAEDENSNFIGACISHKFIKNWIKISTLFVLADYRNLGIGKRLFCESCEDAAKAGKNIYTSSRNPTVIRVLEDLKFIKFESLNKLLNSYRNHKFLFVIHYIKWIMNTYRLKEMARKKITYRKEQPFIHAVKINRFETVSQLKR